MDADTVRAHVREFYDAFRARDLDRYRERMADDIVWHVPGNNPVSGMYRGKQEYLGTMVDRMQPLDEWVVTVEQVLVNEKDRAALVRFHLDGLRKERRVAMEGYHLVRLDDQGLVVEGWGFTEDQAALDEFFSA